MQMLEMINVSCDVAATTDYQRATTHHRLIIIQPCILFRINSYGIKLHRAKFFKFWDIASVVCEEAKKNGEDDVAG